MDERMLLQAAMVTAIVSIILIGILSYLQDAPRLNIGEAVTAEEGDVVRVSGNVVSVRAKEGFSVITIAKKEEIQVVAFENVSAKKGDYIMVLGKTKDYEGKKELVAQRIVVE